MQEHQHCPSTHSEDWQSTKLWWGQQSQPAPNWFALLFPFPTKIPKLNPSHQKPLKTLNKQQSTTITTETIKGKNPNKRNKKIVSIELDFIQKHLSSKKKVGTEAGWGQPVILGKESEELYLLLSLLKKVWKFFKSLHLLSHLDKKKVLEKCLKNALLYLDFSF